jgi:dTDP-4-dehydrorhamnose 3,5-epimerase-like enzyme
MMDEIRLIEGGTSVDDRGEVAFINEIDFDRVRRLYTVTNHAAGSVRAWHAHRREAKFVAVTQGAAVVAAVRIDNWDRPSKDAAVERYVLSAQKPALLYIPAGFANGAMTLTADTKLIYFSTASLEESRADDIRYDARYWDPWQVEDR